jgi:hypothetical protein
MSLTIDVLRSGKVRLKFGDPEQISVLKDAERAQQKKENACGACDGDGEVECGHCEGFGTVDCDECDGSGEKKP